MNRQIIFRGKRQDGTWIYGDLSQLSYNNENCAHIFPQCEIDEILSPDNYEVDFSTVGQFTGLRDKNGVNIYEGDIISKDGCHSLIMFGKFNSRGCIVDDFIGFYSLDTSDCAHSIGYAIDNGYIITGNRFDNPELLTDKK